MRKGFILIILTFFASLLVACGGTSKEVPVTVEITKEIVKEVTVIVTATPVPTATPMSEAVQPTGDAFALNDLGEYESGGIKIIVRRIMCTDKETINKERDGAFDLISAFDNTPVICSMVYEVHNTTDITVNLYPDQGKIQINDEIVDLLNFFLASFGDDVSGEIPPGARLIGGQWFGVKRQKLEDITQMIWRFDGPSDANFNRLGLDFEIVLDVSDHRFDPLPDELKNP